MISPIAHKIIKVGNSLAVTLPNEFVKRHRLRLAGVAFSQSVNGEIKYATSKGKQLTIKEYQTKIFPIDSPR